MSLPSLFNFKINLDDTWCQKSYSMITIKLKCTSESQFSGFMYICLDVSLLSFFFFVFLFLVSLYRLKLALEPQYTQKEVNLKNFMDNYSLNFSFLFASFLSLFVGMFSFSFRNFFDSIPTSSFMWRPKRGLECLIHPYYQKRLPQELKVFLPSKVNLFQWPNKGVWLSA